ncbi:MAG: YoaK family protein [Rhodococcus sp. (in: high G+C Gram-positive bacteria)]|uniref:YoaK family protein n=1 Tax=Rhodococcus sp. TaxID=1831 RepID=UPI003BB7BDEC
MVTQTSTSLRFALVLTLVGGYLDAYTFITRDGVFANAQTANVILMGIDLSEAKWQGALAHMFPILAFLAGIGVAMLIKTGRIERRIARPLRWTTGLQATILVVVGFVPTGVPAAAVTVPIAFVAALQMGLYRTIGDLTYMSIATTGNLMRLTEAGFRVVVEHDHTARPHAVVYASICAVFAVGAVFGAVVSQWIGVRSAWVPAAILVVALLLFYLDDKD